MKVYKTKTVNISLPTEVLTAIDKKAREEYKSRSDLVREAALEYIGKQNFWVSFRADSAARAKELGLKTEGDIEKLVDTGRK